MLVEFKFSNFMSFKEEAVFSMEPLSQNGTNPNTIDTNLKKVPQLYRTAGVFGANASGKTNFIKAIAFLQLIIQESYKKGVDEKFPEIAYLLGDRKDKPSIFEIKFTVNDRLYEYKVTLLDNRVDAESLYYYPISQTSSARANRVFDREYKGQGKYTFEKISGIMQSWSDETIATRLFLSEIVNNRKCQVKEVQETYEWLTKTLLIMDRKVMSSVFSLDQIAAGEGKEIISLLKKADLGLEDIKVDKMSAEEYIKHMQAHNQPISPKAVEKLMSGQVVLLNAKSYHKMENGSLCEFDYEKMESAGTQSFLSLVGPLLKAIKQGQVILVDELDVTLHPYLVKYFVEMFNDKNINDKNAQLIFTSHAHYLMNGEHLSRDQIWLTSKELNKGFYSDLYSLSDFKQLTRKNATFQDAYLDGIYGAVPIVEKL